jgi:phage major head subunit gpT-like protein
MVPFAEKLRQAQLEFSGAFNDGVESMKDGVDLFWQMKAQRISMPGVEEVVFGYLAEQPQFRLWQGERQAKRLKTASYSLRTQKYEWSYELLRDDVKFDRIGLLTGHLRGAGRASRMFYEKLVNAAQTAGKTTACVDGQFFYDTDHPQALDGSGSTFSNLRTGMALTAPNVVSGLIIMHSLIDANGDNMGVRPNILEYGTAQFEAVRLIFEAEITAQAYATALGQELHTASNVSVRGMVTPVLNPNLESGVWYLHDTRNMMPLILLEEEPPTGIEMRDDPRDPHVWDNDAFLFGERARAGAGYGLPHNSQRNEI